MKIAYLILAHGNFNHLNRLIGAINDENVEIYVHVDKKAKTNFQSDLPNVHVLEGAQRVKVYWAGVSIVMAILNLLKYARQHQEPDYYILLSGADYPIRSKQFLYDLLAQKREYITSLPVPFYPHKPLTRFENYYFEFDRRGRGLDYYFYKTIEFILRNLKIKRKFDFKPYAGFCWFALTKECIAHIIGSMDKNKKMFDFFKHTLISDESFIHCFIADSPFQEKVAYTLTYTEFTNEKWSPEVIASRHVELFKQQTEFEDMHFIKYTPCFARKFEDDSEQITALIDRELLGKT
jgi:hypothetical protein